VGGTTPAPGAGTVTPTTGQPGRSRSAVRRFFEVGGPAFNGMLVVVLGALSAAVVALPGRRDDLLRELGLSGAVVQVGEVGAYDGDGPLNRVDTATTAPPASTTTSSVPGARAGASTTKPLVCSDFERWADAQAYFSTDPAAHAVMDGDGDGRACEGLTGTPVDPTPATAKATVKPKVWQCTDFATQPEAQAHFASDPEAYGALDGDHDGLACEGLPGTPVQQKTVIVPTKAEILAQDRVYFGLHTPDAPFWFGEFEELGGMVGKSPSSVLFFQNFSQSFPTEALQSSWRRNALPIITWEPTIPNSAIGQPKLKDLTSGSWDRYLDAWARAAAAFDKPVVIRFAHEMNGVWYTWSEGAWGNQPGDYVKAWRYIHDRFTAAGADNVIWMWNPNRVDYQRTPLETVYPGDEYVDWVGISGYYRRTNGASNFDATFSRTLEAIAAITTKPIFVGEAGADSGDLAGDVAWIADFFRGLAGHPGIVGFAWFNQAKSGNDWRLQRAPELLSAFSEGVRGDRFIGG